MLLSWNTMEGKVGDVGGYKVCALLQCLCAPPPVPPSPPNYTPVKLEHIEQLELGYMPLRDDFERVRGLRQDCVDQGYNSHQAEMKS